MLLYYYTTIQYIIEYTNIARSYFNLSRGLFKKKSTAINAIN